MEPTKWTKPCPHGTYIRVAPEISPNPDKKLPGGGNARADFWRKGLEGKGGAWTVSAVMRVEMRDRNNSRKLN